MASTQCDPEQLKEIFNRFNMDKDGSLTLLELAARLRSLGRKPTGNQIHTIFDSMDANGYGAIEFDELVELMISDISEVVPNHNQLVEVFKAFDRDGNGHITAAELASQMAKMGQPLTYNELTEMMQEANINGNGVISFQEFANFMAKSAGNNLSLPSSCLES